MSSSAGSVRQFLERLVKNHVDLESGSARLDFLAASFAESADAGRIADAIEGMVEKELRVGVSGDLVGTGVPTASEETVGALYFSLPQLAPAAKIRTRLHQSTGLAGYEKIRVVGKGAFGSAVLYRRKDDGSLVVIKEIDMHALSAQERTLALNEVAVLSKLEHPNIVSYFDSFEEEGVLMIEMEFADGGNLSQVLSKLEKPLEEKEILDLFQQIVSAVRYLHENNVLHRDLKTANIFLTKEKFIKVGDFGISKVMGTVTQKAGAVTVLGTPYYISPEMCEGKPYNEKSDLMSRFLDSGGSLGTEGEEEERSGARIRSVLYHFHPRNSSISTFTGLPARIRVRQIAMSDTHTLLCTYDKVVYAWGDNSEGALGLEDRVSRDSPTRVPSLTGKAIVKVAAGDGFSTFVSENGIVMSCGRGDCAGQGRPDVDELKPRLVDGLLSVDAVSLACGARHTLVVGREGSVWAWGWGGLGRLGTGSGENEDRPVEIVLGSGISARLVRAAADASAILTDAGAVLAFGSNRRNKLNLNRRIGALAQLKLTRSEVEQALMPTPVRSPGGRIVDVSLGRTHSALLMESGHVYLFGANDCGQLGRGDVAAYSEPSLLKALADKVCVTIHCGTRQSLALTSQGGLYFWGARAEREPSVVSKAAISVRTNASTEREEDELGVQKQPPEYVVPDTVMLRTVSAQSSVGKALSALVSSTSSLLLLVDTTAPLPPKPRSAGTKGTLIQKLPQQASLDVSEKSEEEINAETKVQTWIEQELADAQTDRGKKREMETVLEDVESGDGLHTASTARVGEEEPIGGREEPQRSRLCLLM